MNRKRYTELRDLLLPMEPADIAILADDLDDEKTLPLLFRLLPKEQAAAEALLASDPALARHPATAERVQKLFHQSENSLN